MYSKNVPLLASAKSVGWGSIRFAMYWSAFFAASFSHFFSPVVRYIQSERCQVAPGVTHVMFNIRSTP